jgi:hypothetical protein
MTSAIKFLSTLLTFFLLFGCAADQEKLDTEIQDNSATKKFNLMASGDSNFPINIAVLDKSIEQSEPTIAFNDATGKLEVSSGNKFKYLVTELTIDLSEKKKQLEAGIFKITYNIDLPDKLIYRSELPDGSNAHYHFILVKKIDAKTFVFEDNLSTQFNLSEVNLMVEALQKSI